MRKTTEQKAAELAEQTLKLKRKIACERKPELLDALAIARALIRFDAKHHHPSDVNDVLELAVLHLESLVDLAAQEIIL